MILSIESSCDDSSIALTQIIDKRLVFHKKISQDSEHALHGGVVPELASRLHAVALPQILHSCKQYLPYVKAVAVTYTPGLSITLLEGVSMAQALCLFLKVPLIGVHHLRGHLYSLFIEQETILPLNALLVSGGHTLLLHANQKGNIQILAKSMDDSFGESFDKVAKMLSLGYPGGPVIENLAKQGDSERFKFTIPLTNHAGIAFSFSGLKNAVRLVILELTQKESANLSEQNKADICASFQKIAIMHVVQQCKRFLKQLEQTQTIDSKDFAIVGGASANLSLRKAIKSILEEYQLNLKVAPLEFCSDNAAMIGRVGVDHYLQKNFTPLQHIKIAPRTKSFF